MSNNTKIQVTPLWVIGMFVGVCEVVAGVTVVKTDGVVQIGSLIFMSVFAFSVAFCFFMILWKRNEVFFPPEQFENIDMKQFVDYIGSGRGNREKTVVDKVTEDIIVKINEDQVSLLKEKQQINTTALEASVKKVARNFIDIKFASPPFKIAAEQEQKISLYATDWPTVSDFLNEVYLSATDAGVELPIFTYGRYWEIKNERNKKVIKKNKLGNKHDYNEFSTLDIKPGDTLIAKRV